MKRPKLGRRLGLLYTLAVVLIAVWALSGLSNQPAKGSLKLGALQPATLASSFDLRPTGFSGQRFSFNYPAGLKEVAAEAPSGPILEQYDFRGRDVATWTLAVSDATLPAGDINQNSSYSYRRANPSLYKASTQQINGQLVYLFSDLSDPDFSESAFMIHQNQIASVALSGADTIGDQTLMSALNTLLTSWRWH